MTTQGSAQHRKLFSVLEIIAHLESVVPTLEDPFFRLTRTQDGGCDLELSVRPNVRKPAVRIHLRGTDLRDPTGHMPVGGYGDYALGLLLQEVWKRFPQVPLTFALHSTSFQAVGETPEAAFRQLAESPEGKYSHYPKHLRKMAEIAELPGSLSAHERLEFMSGTLALID